MLRRMVIPTNFFRAESGAASASSLHVCKDLAEVLAVLERGGLLLWARSDLIEEHCDSQISKYE
jgi:hypothetical protein